MSRYSDIKKGAQLNAALTSYTNYLTTPRDPQVNSRGARPDQQATGVVPFDLDVGADEFVQVNSPQSGVARLAAVINADTDAEVLIGAALNAGTPVSFPGFKPARVVTFESTTRTVEIKRSDVTNKQYLKYTGDRFACAFGRQSDTETAKMIDIYNSIKGALKARTGLPINRISITPEKFSFR